LDSGTNRGLGTDAELGTDSELWTDAELRTDSGPWTRDPGLIRNK